jgi:hypothetical protein
MSILEEIKRGVKEAAKARDQVHLDTLRMAQSTIHYREIDKKGPLSEEEIQRVLMTLCKQRKESIDQFKKGGRSDLVDKETKELKLLESLLPQQMSRAEIEVKVREVLQALGATSAKDIGRVMKVLMKELAGRLDGSLLSEVVKGLLK